MTAQGDAPICIGGLEVVHYVVRLLLVVVVHQVKVVLGGRSAVYAWVPGESRPGRWKLQLRHRQEQEQVEAGAGAATCTQISYCDTAKRRQEPHHQHFAPFQSPRGFFDETSWLSSLTDCSVGCKKSTGARDQVCALKPDLSLSAGQRLSDPEPAEPSRGARILGVPVNDPHPLNCENTRPRAQRFRAAAVLADDTPSATAELTLAGKDLFHQSKELVVHDAKGRHLQAVMLTFPGCSIHCRPELGSKQHSTFCRRHNRSSARKQPYRAQASDDIKDWFRAEHCARGGGAFDLSTEAPCLTACVT